MAILRQFQTKRAYARLGTLTLLRRTPSRKKRQHAGSDWRRRNSSPLETRAYRVLPGVDRARWLKGGGGASGSKLEGFFDGLEVVIGAHGAVECPDEHQLVIVFDERQLPLLVLGALFNPLDDRIDLVRRLRELL